MSNRRISISLFFNLFAIATIALLPQAMFGAAAKTTTSAAVTVPDRITQGIDETRLVTLSRNTRPEANAKNDRGAVPEGLDIDHMLLLLQRSPATGTGAGQADRPAQRQEVAQFPQVAYRRTNLDSSSECRRKISTP